MFAETSTKDISKEEQPEGFSENLKVAQSGGEVAKIARDALEKRIGKSVITSQNAMGNNQHITGLIKDVGKEVEE